MTSATNRFRDWIAAYEAAWRSPGTDKAVGLFTEDATYRPAPFEKPLTGHDAIAVFWEHEREGPDEKFTMSYEIIAAQHNTAVARVQVRYDDPPQKTYRDLWIITLANDGRCSAFEEWPFHADQPRTAS